MKKEELDNGVLKFLRDKNLIMKNECAYKIGDLLVAECVVTNTRRVLGNTENVIEDYTLSESNTNKKVLKG